MKGVTARVQHEDAVAAWAGQRERFEADRARLRAVDPRPRAAAPCRRLFASGNVRRRAEFTRRTTRASTSVRTTMGALSEVDARALATRGFGRGGRGVRGASTSESAPRTGKW